MLKVGQNFRAYRQTRKLIKENCYNLIHNHSPIGGLLSRIAARDIRKRGTKVIYTAHGFHFFKGAPKMNWLIFYPVEKLSSRWTDVLITITHEDYALAQEKMKAKKVVYVPGVGIDTSAFMPDETASKVRTQKRAELDIKDSDIVLLSVGELNKNHEVIIRAMAKLANRNVHYVIAGRGILKNYIEKLAEDLGVKEQLHLLGFRTDVKDLFKTADVFVHPSFREGLSVAVMEAMASSLPIICSKIRGNTDLIDNGRGGFLFNPADMDNAYNALKDMVTTPDMKAFGLYNVKRAESLDVQIVLETMRVLYS